MPENPYLSPRHAPTDSIRVATRWFAPLVVALATCGFWGGVFLAVSGSFISFYPGAECGWFVVSGVLLALGFLIPKRRYRVAASIGCILCFVYAYDGYLRGVKYREWLRERESISHVHTLPNKACPQSSAVVVAATAEQG